MGKIDTSEWKEFSVCELFGKSRLGKYHSPESLVESETGYPYICASNQNNGVNQKMSSVSGDDVRPTPQDIISWGKQCPYFTFHEEPCVTGQGMYYIVVPKYIPRRAIRYVITVLQSAVEGKFGYSNCFIGSSMDDLSIKLPATHDGAPDWAYMESYMANLETKVAESLTMLQAAKDAEKKKVDTREWGEFRVGELFKKLNLRFLPNRVFDKASDISEVKSEEFNLPLVNAKHSNNGIMYYGRKHEWEYEVLTIDIVADGAASTGDVYAQPQETGVLYNAYLVKPKAKCVTGLILFFLSTVIQRCVKDHFGYDNKCTWDKVKHETILLPVDKTGQPDWAYMEEYMRKVEEKTENTLNQFMLV